MRWVYDICVSDCRALPPFSGRRSIRRARNLLRFAGRAAGFRATDSRWIDEALRQIAASDALAQTCVASVDGELHVYRGEIHLVAPAAGIPDAPLRWSGQRELSWAGGRLRFVTVRGAGIGVRNLAGAEVCVAARCGGERLQPEARRPRHCVRKLLQDAALPPWQRVRLPLLWVAGELAWVAGIGVDVRFACASGDDGVLPLRDPDCAQSGSG